LTANQARIDDKARQRAALHDAVAVQRKRASLCEERQRVADEKAATKLDKERYLNQKHQERYRERERIKKAKQKETEPEAVVEERAKVASLPIAVHTKRQNWYDPLYWNDIMVALQESGFNSRQAVHALQAKFHFDGRFNRLSHSTAEGWFSRTVDKSGMVF
jgi:hypothetical protein